MAARAVEEPLPDLVEGEIHPGVGHICADCRWFRYTRDERSHMGECSCPAEDYGTEDWCVTVDVEPACPKFMHTIDAEGMEVKHDDA